MQLQKMQEYMARMSKNVQAPSSQQMDYPKGFEEGFKEGYMKGFHEGAVKETMASAARAAQNGGNPGVEGPGPAQTQPEGTPVPVQQAQTLLQTPNQAGPMDSLFASMGAGNGGGSSPVATLMSAML